MGTTTPGLVAPEPPDLDLRTVRPGDPAQLVARADVEGRAFEGVAVPALTLTDALLVTCRLAGLDAPEADLRGTRFQEVELTGVRLPAARAARCRWSDVRLDGRLGVVEASGARWSRVVVSDAKIDYLSLRDARLEDVLLADSVIGELDLTDAELRRVALPGTRVRSLSVQGTRNRDLDLRAAELDTVDRGGDLRGATVTPEQLVALSPLLARELGIAVRDSHGA